MKGWFKASEEVILFFGSNCKSLEMRFYALKDEFESLVLKFHN